MLRIGEFSELSSISIYMLRNYDKIGLLTPKHIDKINGYRYYDKEQLVQANQILALKSMGFGLDTIKDILVKQTSDIQDVFRVQLQEKLRELETVRQQIRQIQDVLYTDCGSEELAISIARKAMAALWTVSFRGKIDEYSQEGILWAKLGERCKDHSICISSGSPAIAIYHGTDEQNRIDVEVCFPLDKEYPSSQILKVSEMPGGEIVSVIFKGGYSQIGRINTVIADWLEKNSLKIGGKPFSIYHNSPGNCDDPASFVTELCFPVQK